MSDGKKYDEETQKFYDENREMIEKILSMEKGSKFRENAEYLEEKAKRAAFETRIRAEYEAEKARRMAFVKADQLHDDMIDARVCTEEAFEEARDHIRDYSRRQGDYIFNLLTEEFDRARANVRRGREFMKDRYEEDKDDLKEVRNRFRESLNSGFDEVFGPFTDSQFQKHVVGAGLEFWMALNALVRAAPVPDSVKEAFSSADANKNQEFCAKNEDCCKKTRTEDTSSRQIKITPLKKESEE